MQSSSLRLWWNSLISIQCHFETQNLPLFSEQPLHPYECISLYDCDELLFNIIRWPILFISPGSRRRSSQGVCHHFNIEDEMTVLRWLAPFASGALTTQTGNEEKWFYWAKPLKPGDVPSLSRLRGALALCALVCIYWQNVINRGDNRHTETQPVVVVWLSP